MSDRIAPISRFQPVHRVMRVEPGEVKKAKPAGPTFAEVLREAIERKASGETSSRKIQE